uniref:ATP synthase subunit a n=1 Tax=Hirondellea gigas TaxID=1518452 RepID=A0A1B1RRY0_9CRUS|nr:ATP synthase F0 subunit 6 [Hirondellea gigas]
MMTNLFSIFDPATPSFLSSNWLSVSSFLFFLPLVLWQAPSRFSSLFFLLKNYLYMEFKPLLKKSPFILVSVLTFFLFILLNNVLGLLPYIFTASSHMVLSLSMALPYWLSLMLYGWFNNTSNLLMHLIPKGTPMVLMPFMVLIETVSTLIRPLTLAIRLSANMIAGHLLLTLLSASFSALPFFSMPILLVAQIMLCGLEIAVAVIQAYVFSVLITLYASESIN